VQNDSITMTNVAVAPPAEPRAAGVGSRPLRRRGALPTGRAVVGGFLVALAALGIFVGYTRATAGPTARYVVARRDIPVGSRLTADDLTTLPMDLPAVVAANAAFTRESRVVGATTVGPIRKGELVQAGSVVAKRSSADELEVSFSIASARALAGTLRSGDRIDVLATFGTGADTYTVTVVRQARVVDAGRAGGALADGQSETITVALASSEKALALSHAVSAGEVTLARSTGANVSGQVGQTYRAPANKAG
jgi:Flp pilus assembly protein CpaB